MIVESLEPAFSDSVRPPSQTENSELIQFYEEQLTILRQQQYERKYLIHQQQEYLDRKEEERKNRGWWAYLTGAKEEPTDVQPELKIDLLLTAKVLMVGDEGVGKTSITRRYCHGVFYEGRQRTSDVASYQKMKVMQLSEPALQEDQ